MALQAMTVPTVFTAKDRFSSVINTMTKSTNGFVSGIKRIDQRVNNSFNSMNRFSQLAIGAGAGALFYKAGEDVIAYEKAIASLGAVTGTVVGSMSKDIESLGKETKRSVIDIAGSFENIGSKMSEYLKNPTALREIAKQSILMADASRMGLDESTDNLTSILNQFKLSYKDAGMVVNKLSSGEDIGASTISESSDVVRQFAASARMAGADLVDTIALVQSTTKTLGKEGVGRGFRNLMVDLNTGKGMDKNKQRALKMVGADINKIINPSTKFIEKLREIKKLLSNKQAMGMFFKKTGFETGATFLGSFKMFEDMRAHIKENDTAIVKATKNNQTFAKSWLDLKNTFTNYIVTQNETNTGLNIMKGLLGWLKDNMGLVITSVVSLGVAFLGLKVLIGVNSMIIGTGKAIRWLSLAIRDYRMIQLAGAISGRGFFKTIMTGTIPIRGLVPPVLMATAAIGGLAYMMKKSTETTRNFADSNNTSFNIATKKTVGSLAEIMDAMDKAIAKIKKLKNAQDSLSQNEFSSKKMNDVLKYTKTKLFQEEVVKKTDNVLIKKEKVIGINSNKIYDANSGENIKNLAGYNDNNIMNLKEFLTSKSGKLELFLSTEKGVEVNVKGEIPKGIVVKTGSTTGVKN